jgi:hypothetical protein
MKPEDRGAKPLRKLHADPDALKSDRKGGWPIAGIGRDAREDERRRKNGRVNQGRSMPGQRAMWGLQ